MDKHLKIVFMTVLIFAASVTNSAFAQWDNKGCSDYGIDINNPHTMEQSLWTFRSNPWDGYIDFMPEGKYWTHWGMGTWTVVGPGKIHMANDYNERTYEVDLTDNGYQFIGTGNNGVTISGRLLCSKYEGAGPQVDPGVTKAVKTLYRKYMGRDPSDKEYVASYRKYLQAQDLNAVKDMIFKTPEYKEKAAANAAAAAAKSITGGRE